MKYDYAVIGGGMSGVAVALILAKHGRQVVLVEESEQLTPVLRGFTRAGLHFDTGFHYSGGLEPGGILRTYLSWLGLMDRIALTDSAKNLADSFRMIDPPFAADIPFGYERLQDSLCRQFPDARDGLIRYLEALRGEFLASSHLNLELDEDAPGKNPTVHERSLRQVLDAMIDNPVAQSLLAVHGLLYGMDPEDILFTDHARFIGSYYQSAHRIRGSGASLAKACAEALAEAGVTVLTGRGVKAIHATPLGDCGGLELEDGERIDCAGCVATVHPRTLVSLAPAEAFRPVYRKRLLQLEDTFSAYMLFCELLQPVTLLERGNVHVCPSPWFRVNRLSHTPIEARPLFVASAGAPGETRGIEIICPALPSETHAFATGVRLGRTQAYREFKAELTERLLAYVVTALPELKGTVRVVACATPLTFRDYTNSPGGALYGTRHVAGNPLPLPLTRLNWLFVAGQAVTGPGVLGAIISATLACECLLGVNTVRKELRRCHEQQASSGLTDTNR